MALTWALTGSRTYLNDANRGRFSALDPKPNDNPGSLGPAGYNPKYTQVTKHVLSLPPSSIDKSQVLSNGVPIRHLLPIGPGSYESPDLWSRHRPQQRVGVDGRRANSPGVYGGSPERPPLNPYNPNPGPGDYEPNNLDASVSLPIPKSPRGVVEGSGSWRCGPPSPPKAAIPKKDKLPLIADAHVPEESEKERAARGTQQTVASTARRPQQNTLSTKGCSMSRAVRHFNLHNVNSFSPRERDMNYAHPPPGWYSPRTVITQRSSRTVGAFSKTPRVIDLSNKTPAPGPGAYNPITKDIVQKDYTLM